MCVQLFTALGSESEVDFYLQLADGFILVYEITSSTSFDLVMSTRQKILARTKDVSGRGRGSGMGEGMVKGLGVVEGVAQVRV